jgi:hypothetical protein
MAVEMAGAFNGYEIKFSEDTGTWNCAQLRMKAGSLSGLKSMIRKHDKSESDFKRCTALMKDSAIRPTLVEVTVTSLVLDQPSWQGKQAWINRDGKRSKVSMRDLYMDTAANRKLSAEALALYLQIDLFHKKAAQKIDKCKKMFKVTT